jgi:uncharacterized protein
MTAMKHPTRIEFPHRLALKLLAALAMAMALLTSARAQTGPVEELDKFPHSRLEITDGKKLHVKYEIWEANTPQRQAQGLMFVHSLPQLQGMLFVHENPRPASMWMKNCYISLDMVFIDTKGRIQEIVERTTPHSEEIIRSKLPVYAVLEIGGGEAQRLGLKPGQRVKHPAFPRR